MICYSGKLQDFETFKGKSPSNNFSVNVLPRNCFSYNAVGENLSVCVPNLYFYPSRHSVNSIIGKSSVQQLFLSGLVKNYLIGKI